MAAAAGSGKTRLLVASVVRALTEEGLPPERLVAVTFTRKAGAELASRVREALQNCGRTDLARSLDAASLGTIDSLCRRLVKDEALAAGVDPGCAVLEAEAAGLVKVEVARQAWEVVVEQADEVVLEVLASQGARLRADVISLYDRLRGSGLQEPYIQIPAGPSEESVREHLVQVLREALQAGHAQPRPSASLSGDLAKLAGCLEWIEGPEEARAAEAGLHASKDFFPSRRTRTLEEQFSSVRSALAAYRCALAEARLGPLVEVVNRATC